MSINKVDCSSIRTVRVHKEQFDAILEKAETVIITCIEDGRCVAFNRAPDIQENSYNPGLEEIGINHRELLKELMKKYSFEKSHSYIQIATQDMFFENVDMKIITLKTKDSYLYILVWK